MPVADGLDVEIAAAEAVLVEKRAQRREDQQWRTVVALGVGVGGDDVVRCGFRWHRTGKLVASVNCRDAPDSRVTATFAGTKRF